MQAKVGDRIRVTYFEPETTHGEERETTAEFRVKAIVPLTEPKSGFTRRGPAVYDQRPTPVNDPDLTPEVKGITDQASIADWDAPFPFDYKLIRDQDDTYWENHRTTPKAARRDLVEQQHGHRLLPACSGGATRPLLRRPYGSHDAGHARRTEKAAEATGTPLAKGVYMWFSGPSFETPAEIRMARTMVYAVGHRRIRYRRVPPHSARLRQFPGHRHPAAGMTSGDGSQETKHVAPPAARPRHRLDTCVCVGRPWVRAGRPPASAPPRETPARGSSPRKRGTPLSQRRCHALPYHPTPIRCPSMPLPSKGREEPQRPSCTQGNHTPNKRPRQALSQAGCTAASVQAIATGKGADNQVAALAHGLLPPAGDT